jgi:hypothetical protein
MALQLLHTDMHGIARNGIFKDRRESNYRVNGSKRWLGKSMGVERESFAYLPRCRYACMCSLGFYCYLERKNMGNQRLVGKSEFTSSIPVVRCHAPGSAVERILGSY